MQSLKSRQTWELLWASTYPPYRLFIHPTPFDYFSFQVSSYFHILLFSFQKLFSLIRLDLENIWYDSVHGSFMDLFLYVFTFNFLLKHIYAEHLWGDLVYPDDLDRWDVRLARRLSCCFCLLRHSELPNHTS